VAGGADLVRAGGLIFRRTAREAAGNAALAFAAPTLLAVFLLVLFQGVYGNIADAPGWPTDDFLDWVAAGGVLLSVFVGAGYTAGGLLRDLDSGYLDRLRLLPIPPASVLLGKIAFEVIRATIPATAVLGLAILLGAENSGGIPGFVAVIGMAMALAVAWNGIFYLSALKTRSHAAVLGLQPLFMPVIMFSTFWVPTTFMPGWYRTVATWNPFTPTIDACRSILLGNTDWNAVAVAATVLVVLTGATYTLAARLYRQAVTAD
jgi:ABC-2 type transport system permease protein